MLVDAREKFAERVAKWMSESTLTTLEMSQRLNKWPNDFIELVLKAHRKLQR